MTSFEEPIESITEDVIAIKKIDTPSDIAKAMASGSKDLHTKFDQQVWNQVEVKVNEHTLGVIDVLNKRGRGDNTATFLAAQQVIGEESYLKNRKLLIDWKFGKLVNIIKSEKKEELESDITKTNKLKKNKKPKAIIISASDKIRIENTNKKVEKIFIDILESFTQHKLNTTMGLKNCKILEINAVTLMYASWFVLNHPDIYNKPSKLIDIYELIVGIEKFIVSTNTYIGKSMVNSIKTEEISKTVFIDLLEWLNKLKSTYKFSGLKLQEIAPRLLVFTNYDSIIPSHGLKLRKNQEELMEYIDTRTKNKHENETGFLISYNAMIGSGKTTFAAIALSSRMKTMNELFKASGVQRHMQLIFCCNLRSVMLQVANLAYNAGIKFGVATVTSKGVVRIINHFNCSNDAERVLIICSPDVGQLILKEDIDRIEKTKTSSNYWLFLDEPTIGADQLGSEGLNKNIGVMMYMPQWTILSSATMPNIELLTNLTDNHLKRFPLTEIKTIYSNEIQIGCDVKTLDCETVIPHLGCKTRDELLVVINSIEKNPFLGRMYTHTIVRKLWSDLTNIADNVPDINEIFANVNNLSFDKVRQVAMNLLKIMLTVPNKNIEEICSSNIFDTKVIGEPKPVDDDENGFVFEDDIKETQETKKCVDYTKLGTSDAYKYMNMNLIATTEPIKFTINNFAPLIKKLKESGVEPATRLIAKYERDLDIFNKAIDRIESRSTVEYTKTIVDKNNRTVKQTERSLGKLSTQKIDQEIQQSKETMQPKINFPEWAQVNTLEHIKMFAPRHIKEINPAYIRNIYPPEKLPFDSNVSDDITLLLMAGIGIYAPSSKELDEQYSNHVLEMASVGNLAYLIADSSICYGTNYPINRVFITKEFANVHSINTWFQLMGRAGRVGQSWMAEVFMPNESAEILIKYVSDKNNESNMLEITNMQQTIETFLHNQIANEVIANQKLKLAEDVEKRRIQEKEFELKLKMEMEKNKPDPKDIVSISSVTNSQNWHSKHKYPDSDERKSSWRSSTKDVRDRKYASPTTDNKQNWRDKSSDKQPTSSYVPPHLRKTGATAATTTAVPKDAEWTEVRRNHTRPAPYKSQITRRV